MKTSRGKLALILGAVALFGVGLLVGRIWPDRRAEASSSSSLVEDDIAWPVWLGAAAAPSRVRSSVAASEPKSVSPGSPVARARFVAAARGDDASAVMASVTGIANDDSHALGGVSETASASAVQTSSVVAVPELTLRGTLQSAGNHAVEVEFALRRRNESVSGVVRYLADGERVAANAVSGRIVGRVVELRETSFIWRLGPRSAPVFVEVGLDAPLAAFVFEFPVENKTGPIFGDWSRGRQAGTLSIVPSLPW